MRKFAIAFFLIAVLASNPACAGKYDRFLKAMDYVAQEFKGLKLLASQARLHGDAPSTSNARSLVKTRISKLNSILEDANRDAEPIRLELLNEKWRNRADRGYDIMDAIDKVEQLDDLMREYRVLAAEFCGPSDLYQFGDPQCGVVPFRQYGQPR
ncbi:MAG: hypothetical protein WBX25_21870 [Rhodomicrobium sp.]